MKLETIGTLVLALWCSQAIAADSTVPYSRSSEQVAMRALVMSPEMRALREEAREAEASYRAAVDALPEVAVIDAEVESLMTRMHELRKQRRNLEKTHAVQLSEKRERSEKAREKIKAAHSRIRNQAKQTKSIGRDSQ